MSRWVRPARPVAPMVVTVVVVGTWWLVAHNSGAGWVQALGEVLFGTLVIGTVGPAVILARARLRVVSAPVDAAAGLPAAMRVEVSTRLRVRPAVPTGIETFVGPVGRHRPPDDEVNLLPSRRGVYDAVVLDIASAAPFALQWWTRRVVLPLPAALYVAPRRGLPVALPVRPHEHVGEQTARAAAEVGDPRGARPYRSGDNRRHVHWRATAHTGELMVREVEDAAADPVKVVVALPWDPEAAERVAARALGTVSALLDHGAPVLLATVEPAAPVEATVSDRRGAGRRLACAVAAPGAAPSGPAPSGPPDEAAAITVSP